MSRAQTPLYTGYSTTWLTKRKHHSKHVVKTNTKLTAGWKRDIREPDTWRKNTEIKHQLPLLRSVLSVGDQTGRLVWLRVSRHFQQQNCTHPFKLPKKNNKLKVKECWQLQTLTTFLNEKFLDFPTDQNPFYGAFVWLMSRETWE